MSIPPEPPAQPDTAVCVVRFAAGILRSDGLERGVPMLIGAVVTLLLRPGGASREQIARVTEELVDRIKLEVLRIRDSRN